jgi:uncharacterized membrane protein YdfJ with MMPL/SSD domain
MKIDPLLFKTGEVGGQQGVQDNDKTANQVKFADILNEVSFKRDVTESQDIANIQSVHTSGVTSLQGDAISEGETMLDMLEHLSTMLEGVDSSQGSMEAVADSIQSRLETLVNRRDSLDADDPLRQTLNEIGMLAAVQEAKITRGDYS